MKQRFKKFIQKIKNLSFYRKKPFYIVLVVLLSLMLVFDIVVAILVPEQNNNMFGKMQDIMNNSSFEENTDSETDTDEDDADSSDTNDSDGNDGDDIDFSERQSGGDMDFSERQSGGDMDFSERQSGGDTDFSEKTSGGDTDFSEMPSSDKDTDFGEMPSDGDFDFSEIQQAAEDASNENTGFLQTIKSHWLVIMIILIILDGASIFMLAWISHKEKKLAAELEKERKQLQADGEVHLVRPEKKKKHSPLIWIISIAVIIILIIVIRIIFSGGDTQASETEATVYSETAELSDISTVLPGAGTLTEETAEELSLASDVEITSWYVSNGDTVSEGDVLASVDKVSVMTAIVSVQETINELDEELEEHEDEEISDEITAGADGRVMAVYATEDASVVDVMYEYSSLMLISLDGMLAVDIETDADISVGDAVDVTLSDDTVIGGKVESFINGTTVILVSDEEASLGDTVSVATEDGASIGSGSLYIHSELKVTGFTGTIDDIEVSVGDEVSSGDTLITLDDTEYTGEYDTLILQRNELEEEMQELVKIYQDGYIYASCDGVISGLEDDDEDTDTDASSDDTDEEASSSDDAAAEMTSAEVVITATTVSTVSSGESMVASASTGALMDETASVAAAISGEYINYIGMVTSVSSGTAEMKFLSGTYDIDDYTDLSGINIEEDNMTDNKSIDLSSAKVIFKSSGGVLSVDSLSNVEAGDTLILAYDADNEDSLVFAVRVVEEQTTTGQNENSSEETDSGTEVEQQTNESDQSIDAGSLTGSESDLTGMTDYSASQATDSLDISSLQGSTDTTTGETSDSEEVATETEANYSISETTWLSITPQNTMTITITVDELDILSLETGLDALVTLDAFPGQSFEGEVTSIDTSGTNSGGSTKYTAEITISREEDMLAGMNASVVITLDTKENVLCVPEEALIEENGLVYVYTSYDEDTDTFGDLTEVTTGVSDGDNVEILSGLSEGSEFYYSYLDVVNYNSSSSASTGGASFSLDSLFGGGGGGGR